jgi:hypothetical protein
VRILLAVALLIATVASQAQQPSPAPAQVQQPSTVQQPVVAPAAPIDDGGPAPVNPSEQEAGNTPQGDYQGPAILSRGGGASLARGSELFRIQPYVSVLGIYDTRLSRGAVDSAGRIVYDNGLGMETQFGANGSRRWRRSMLDLDYRGAYHHYPSKQRYDGFDSSLSLGFSHQASRRVTVELTENAARYSRSFFLPYGFGGYNDPMFASMTGNDLFDTPTYVLSSGARLIYQRNARLSFSMGGQGFIARRHSTALIGVNGYTATGDIAYRLDRHQTIAIDYSFTHFDFQNRYGESDTHGVAIDYAVRIGRHWELSLRGGGYRVEASRLRQVTLDPAVAAIIGISTGVEAFDRTVYLPQGGAHLTRSFRRGQFSLAYDRTVRPGNGVYLTSASETAMARYSYTGFRSISLSAGGGSTNYRSVSQTMETYRGLMASVGATYKLNHTMSIVSGINANRHKIGGNTRVMYSVRLGISWMPGDYPVALW